MVRRDIQQVAPEKVDPSWRIGIVFSSFYKEEVDRLVHEAKNALEEAGIPKEGILLHAAPGSFEVPLIGAELADSKQVDALIGLGVIVQGETHHAHLLAEQAARGIMDVQLRYRIPFAFEILYVDDLSQAQVRSDKGAEAAIAILHSLAELRALQS